MAEYPINKGIGRPVEFKGLKAQYLFIFCGGLLALFVLFVILYMVGIDQWICIGFGAASSSLLVWQTFALNARYGEHGLMKLGAARSHPRYLINRRRITRLFKRQRKEETTMRNTSKMTTLENKFPLLAVEHGCIISKDADITVAFEVELPELYTVTGAEYEAIHGCWCKAIKVLPDYCVVHKQDWFIKERYKPELQKDDMSFLEPLL